MDRELYTANALSAFVDACNAGQLVEPSRIFADHPLLTDQERHDLTNSFVFLVKLFYPHLLRAHARRRAAQRAP